MQLTGLQGTKDKNLNIKEIKDRIQELKKKNDAKLLKSSNHEQKCDRNLILTLQIPGSSEGQRGALAEAVPAGAKKVDLCIPDIHSSSQLVFDLNFLSVITMA